MKIFEKAVALVKTTIKRNKIYETVPEWLSGQKYPQVNAGDMNSLLNAYKDIVYTCTNKNAVSFAQQTLKLYVAKSSKTEKLLVKTKAISPETKRYMYKNAGIMSLSCVRKALDTEEVTEHPFIELMKNVNGFMNQFEMMELLDLHLELTGNAYLYVVKNQLGVPAELWVLQPDKVYIVPSKEKWIAGYIYRRADGLEIPFEADEIIHFKFTNPKDQYMGWGPLQAQANNYNLSVSYNNYEKSLMDNSAIPPIALVAPKDTTYTESDWKRILTRWNKTYGGAANQGKTAWLEGGFDVKTLNVSPKDMGYMAGRKWTREEVANGFGVPISKLTSDNVNRANAEVGDYSYMKDTISPRCIRFEQKLNEKLLPMFDERLFVMFDDPVPENKDFILRERESNLNTKMTSINEEREKIGLEPVPWGEFPVGQTGQAPYDGTKPEPVEQPPDNEFDLEAEDDLFASEDEEEKVKELIAETIAEEIIQQRRAG